MSEQPYQHVPASSNQDPGAADPTRAKAPAGHDWSDGRPRRVDPHSITVSRLVGALWAAILAALTLIPLTIFILTSIPTAWLRGAILIGWLAVFLLLGILSWVWPALRYRHLWWWVDGRGVHIKRGVLWREEIAVPSSRIQHTDVSQGPLERSYGIANLIVHTAGTINASVTLSGLSYALALQLRDTLLPGGGDDGV